jgi:hypothetical protein
LVTNEERDGALKIYNQYFMPKIEQYGSVLQTDCDIKYRLFLPTSCIPENKISKRILRSYPFITELQSIILDNFADVLIEILLQNKNKRALNTSEL